MTSRDVHFFDHVLTSMSLAPKTRFLLAALPLLGQLLGCKPLPDSNSEVGETRDFNYAKAMKYPAGILPQGTFAVKLERQPMPYQRLTSIGDGGELLFDTDDGKIYYNISKGVTKEIHRKDSDPWPKMVPDGHIEMSYGNSESNSNFPFETDRSDSGFFNDGSVLIVGVANMPGEKKAVYTLYRKWYSPKIELTKRGDEIIELRSDIIFRAPNRLALLEKSDNETIWVQDHNGSEHRGTDRLIRIQKGKETSVTMPAGYENVQRIAETKGMVVGTFGIFGGVKPFRSFLRIGSDWRELPIPKGYVMSFVQRVMFDGTVLGFVTNSDATKEKNVLWKGDKIAILDEQPAWPRQGPMSHSVLSNRTGLIYVQDQLNKNSQGDYYLLRISVTP
jgi:hypothetical protein